MKAYEKPMILVDDNLTEGVYMASGDTTTVSSGVTATATPDVNGGFYGNYYLTFSGFENGVQYTITCTISETATVYGLTSASWGGWKGCTVTGNTITYKDTFYANQTTGYIRLYFSSQGNWDNGYQLKASDVPPMTVTVTKV